MPCRGRGAVVAARAAFAPLGIAAWTAAPRAGPAIGLFCAGAGGPGLLWPPAPVPARPAQGNNLTARCIARL